MKWADFIDPDPGSVWGFITDAVGMILWLCLFYFIWCITP